MVLVGPTCCELQASAIDQLEGNVTPFWGEPLLVGVEFPSFLWWCVAEILKTIC